MRELKIGIVGSGGMTRSHGQRLLRLRRDAGEAVRIVGIHARSEEKTDAVAAQILKEDPTHEPIPFFADYEALLDREPLDAVFVCLSPDAPVPFCEVAAARGISLFLEKPIALDVARAERVVNAVESAGVRSQIGHHMRFRSAVQRTKAAVDAGETGRPTLFQGRYWTNFRGPEWWANQSRSGGQIHEQLIHIYDMALHLFGPAESASGFLDNLCHKNDADYTIEDTSLGTIRFQSGAVGTIAGSNCAVPHRFTGDFRAVYEKATLDYRCPGNGPDNASLFLHAGPYSTEVQTEEFTETNDPYLLQVAHFLKVLRGEAAEIAPAREGLNGIRLVAAVTESARQGGTPVRVE